MNAEQDKELHDIVNLAKFRVDQEFPIEMRLHGLVEHFNALVGLTERNEIEIEGKDKRIKELETQLAEEEDDHDRICKHQGEQINALRVKLSEVCPHTNMDIAPGIGPFCTFCGSDGVPVKE